MGKLYKGSAMLCFYDSRVVILSLPNQRSQANIGFTLHTGNSNPEINMDTVGCTNLFKVH